MKKITATLVVVALFTLFSSCSKDPLGAKVDVEVVDLLSKPVKGTKVYLFKDEFTLFSKPTDAKKQAVTNNNGIASFSLNLDELSIIESETLLFFAVFYSIGGVEFQAGSKAITVQKGVVKSVRLKVPL